MRFQAIFTCKSSLSVFVQWLVEEVRGAAPDLEVNIKEEANGTEVSFRSDSNECTYTVFSDPSRENAICLRVHPKLKLLQALLGRKDAQRQYAAELVHRILGNSEDISDLGWYLESQIYKGPQSSP